VFDSRKMKVRQNKTKQPVMMTSEKYMQGLLMVYLTYFVKWGRIKEKKRESKKDEQSMKL